MKEIRFHKNALNFLEELSMILIEENYFSFVEAADKYIEDIVNFILTNINNFPHKKAPEFFSKYGKDLLYIFYNRNKNTTWYIFFEKTEIHYIIRHISNNHIVGKYFE